MIETKTIKTTKFFLNSIYEVTISAERKELLKSIATTIVKERHKLNKVRLNFICTHNSRRSQLSQVWAHFAIQHYKLRKIKSFSGGTEVTSFSRNAIKVLQEAGFKFTLVDFSHQNPKYEITAKNMKKPITVHSKTFDDSTNKKPFIAITNCSVANENCPFIPDAIHRFHLPLDESKTVDKTKSDMKKHSEINQQIAAEMNFLFQHVADLL